MYDVPCAICKNQITQESQEATIIGGIVTVAEMIDDERFTYGLSGVFKFKNDLKLKKGDCFCNDCARVQEDNIIPSLSIPCSNCGKLHQPTWAETERIPNPSGWGCATTVYLDGTELHANGGWGSKYDLTAFKVVLPVVKDGDKICDECVDLFVKEGPFIEEAKLPW